MKEWPAKEHMGWLQVRAEGLKASLSYPERTFSVSQSAISSQSRLRSILELRITFGDSLAKCQVTDVTRESVSSPREHVMLLVLPVNSLIKKEQSRPCFITFIFLLEFSNRMVPESSS